MLTKITQLPKALQQYLLITLNYWFFTLTDGALRMLVILHFYQLGYSAIAIAMLFLFYEVFGVVTNLIGGWLGARFGLNRTMNVGLWLQVIALLMLALPEQYLTVVYVMTAQALSGIAKDLNKMSAKSSIKAIVVDNAPDKQNSVLFKWVSLLTGSKNTLKGVGFFIGGFLLNVFGFQLSMLVMAGVLMIIASLSLYLLSDDLGRAKNKPKFKQLFSKNASLNYFSAARLCLFASRDVWFVVALPVYLASQLSWSHSQVGAFLASWIIVYGIVQASAPKISHFFSSQFSAKFSNRLSSLFNSKLSRKKGINENTKVSHVNAPNSSDMSVWAWRLTCFTLFMLTALFITQDSSIYNYVIPIGLVFFAVIFAMNSAQHSYGIVALAKQDGVSMDVGFYYMANALGRLIGTVLSGVIFQWYGIEACLAFAVGLSALAAIFVKKVKI